MLSKRGAKWAGAALATSLTLLLTGCEENGKPLTWDQAVWDRGLLPGQTVNGEGVTNHVNTIVSMWTSSWQVLWGVGIIAWAIMVYALIAYRRKKGDNSTPPQLRYNNPIETLFTVVPMILVIGFFAFTAKSMTEIETPIKNPDVTIEAIGKQWSWDFNYKNENTYETGVQGDSKTIRDESNLPTLWLPTHSKIEIDLNSRDVDHSFWVIDFLYKKDMLPGKTNHMYFETTGQTGTFRGKCAELCGEYHSMMLFNVKIVSPAEYAQHMADLKAAGNVGQLSNELYQRNQNLPGDKVTNEG